MAPSSITEHDMQVLDAVVALAPRRVTVPAEVVLEHLHRGGRPASGWQALRMAVLRLQRDGLLRSEPGLSLEATPDGQVAVELLRARRRAAENPEHDDREADLR